ncbi:MAG: N-6 DNA methylase [Sphingomonadaceae bacterium]|nr:N-6 DNA methylase [Sphingomonadaceae bacterium]
MVLSEKQLQEIVAELLTRPKHEKVRSLLYKLLTDGLGATSSDIDFEKNTEDRIEVRGRIDALLGRTVIEIKSDLRRESFENQLAGYLRERRSVTGSDFVGIVTDGATFGVYELGDDDQSLIALGDYTPNVDAPFKLLRWLESVVALQDRLHPDIPRIRLELGRESVLYHRAMRELRLLWADLADHPEVVLKRQLWDRLLRVAYGTEIDAPELFFQHSYLVILAKTIATLALTGKLPASGRDLLDGEPFRELGILNAVEADFFDWLLCDTEKGDALVLRVAQQARRFELEAIDVDVLKGLYESLIDPATRHDLGEYYTPDWLAARITNSAIAKPLEQRVIDPSCGSGTFLFHALRRLVAAGETAKMDAADIVALAGEKVAGIDIHPVAVIFARATWLLALAPTFAKGRPSSLAVPVYLGDALQWNTRELMSKSELEILVPPANPTENPTVLRFPEDVIDKPQLFDETIDTMLRFAEAARAKSAFADWLGAHGVPGDPKMLADTYEKLVQLNAEGRNHIWGYVARNLSRPIWLATDKQKADVVIGNPPWVRYSALSKANQQRLKTEAGYAQVWVGGKAATANDLCAYFFARAVALYMRRAGKIAFVLPYATMSRDPYAEFRKGDFQHRAQPVAVRFTDAWTFPSDVQPLFPVPSCVLFAEGVDLPRGLPAKILRHSGQLPARDATPEMADAALKSWQDDWPADTGVSASPYREKFRQGATLVPRRLVIVERLPATGRLGSNPKAPLVRGRTSKQDKKPWKDIDPLEGPIEVEFLRPVYLGESIAPYRVLSNVTGIIPWNPNKREVMDMEGAYTIGKRLLADWLNRAEKLWDKHGTGGMELRNRWDYGHALSGQFPLGGSRIVYSKAGTQPAACVISDKNGIIDHKLYQMPVKSKEEGYFLCAILNSETARAAAEQWQSEGQWGKRDFDKAVFNLPIPLFNANDPLHADLAKAAAKAEKLAAKVELKEGEHFTRTRKRIRLALIENGIAAKIEALVAELIGVAPAATVAGDDHEAEEADAD